MNINKRNLTFDTNENQILENIIKDHSIVKKVSRKEIFMYPGEDLDYLYYIKKGRTRHYMSGTDGTEKILYVLAKGWFFGELSLLLDHKKTSLYSEAETDTTLYLMRPKKAQELLDNNKVFRDEIMKAFAFKTIVMRYEIENIIFNPVKDRIKRFLCTNVNYDNLNDSDWIDIDTEYTHYEIGVLIGCTRVTVSKMLNELAKKGFIRVVNKRIQISKECYLDYINQD